MKWQYDPVEPNQPPVVLLLHYRTREELMQIMAPPSTQVGFITLFPQPFLTSTQGSHAHAMMRAAAAASSSLAERSGLSDDAAAAPRGELVSDLNDDGAGRLRLPLDDDGIKIGLRRTFSNSSCGRYVACSSARNIETVNP